MTERDQLNISISRVEKQGQFLKLLCNLSQGLFVLVFAAIMFYLSFQNVNSLVLQFYIYQNDAAGLRSKREGTHLQLI